ncbi:MAG: hypothetical protein AAB571_09495, partial [Chloroflexota bacterium]
VICHLSLVHYPIVHCSLHSFPLRLALRFRHLVLARNGFPKMWADTLESKPHVGIGDRVRGGITQ